MTLNERLIAWDRFLRQIRGFLKERGYYEVQTPSLVPAGAFEATIDALQVRAAEGRSWELHTSPEMEMKRLIAESHLSLFQICKSFRDDPNTGIHLTEFSMLEYYRVFGTYEGLQKEVLELFTSLTEDTVQTEIRAAQDLFFEYTGTKTEIENTDDFRQALSPHASLHLTPDDSWQDLFFKAWVGLIEPQLPKQKMILVRDYPIQIAALAAPHSHAPKYAQRFEVYWQGMELCNGALELKDLATLDTRYKKESALRTQMGKLPHPHPTRLREALEKGLPECVGVAIGLDRLFAALHRTSINP